jgi:adenylate kinase
MVNIVIFGAPGSGKGTQSEMIIENHGLHHISTGEVLREEIAKDSDLGRIANGYISKGHLVPDELIVDILNDMLDEQTLKKGVIFDGFPRTINQAKELQKMLNKRGQDISAVIGLEVPENELITRLVKRGEVSGRSDDNEATIKQRIQVYHKNTEPLMDYYKQAGIYYPIEGKGSVTEIFNQIAEVLKPISEKEGKMRTA